MMMMTLINFENAAAKILGTGDVEEQTNSLSIGAEHAKMMVFYLVMCGLTHV